MNKLSIITIAYNGYSKFIPPFLESVEKQTIQPEEVIIVLADDYILKDVPKNVKIIKSEVSIQGILFNKGIREAKGDWVLLFDVDDTLLENAVEEIKENSKGADMVTLKFDSPYGILNTPEMEKEKIKEWKKHYIDASGYLAFKKQYVEDTDFWKYPLLFKTTLEDKIIRSTHNSCAIWNQRLGSHGSGQNVAKAMVEIDKYANKYLNKKLCQKI